MNYSLTTGRCSDEKVATVVMNKDLFIAWGHFLVLHMPAKAQYTAFIALIRFSTSTVLVPLLWIQLPNILAHGIFFPGEILPVSSASRFSFCAPLPIIRITICRVLSKIAP